MLLPSCVGSCGGDDFVFVVFIGVVVAKHVVICCCCVVLSHGDLVSSSMSCWEGWWCRVLCC